MELRVMKEIKNYPLYFATENGDIVSFKSKNPKILKVGITRNGYTKVTLCKGNKPKTFLLHRLIAEAYIDNKSNYRYVNHIDGNKSNNRIENLEWCTASHNTIHAYNNNLMSAKGEKNGRSKLSEENVLYIRRNYIKGVNRKHLADKFNTTEEYIWQIITRRRWKHI